MTTLKYMLIKTAIFSMVFATMRVLYKRYDKGLPL